MSLRIDLKIFIFLILFYITKQIEMYSILMFFCIIHELGHLVAGLCIGLLPEKIEIMPFGLSISFKLKPKDYNLKVKKASLFQVKKIIIALAGPLVNLILIFIFLYIDIPANYSKIAIYSNILIFLFNMIPIYPLDGGRILKGILHIFYGRKKALIFTNYISNAVMIIFTLICSIAILYLKNISIVLIDLFLWYLIIRENKKFKIYNSMLK
jgi:stage IV sporulation protein FB